jgi:hypothetical protein
VNDEPASSPRQRSSAAARRRTARAVRRRGIASERRRRWVVEGGSSGVDGWEGSRVLVDGCTTARSVAGRAVRADAHYRTRPTARALPHAHLIVGVKHALHRLPEALLPLEDGLLGDDVRSHLPPPPMTRPSTTAGLIRSQSVHVAPFCAAVGSGGFGRGYASTEYRYQAPPWPRGSA